MSMNGIHIAVTGNMAKVTEKPGKITSGTVGLPVEFSFDSQWDDLRKIAVFQAGAECIRLGLNALGIFISTPAAAQKQLASHGTYFSRRESPFPRLSPKP